MPITSNFSATQQFYDGRRIRQALTIGANDPEDEQLRALDVLTGGNASALLDDKADGRSLQQMLADYQTAIRTQDITKTWTPEKQEWAAHEGDAEWRLKRAQENAHSKTLGQAFAGWLDEWKVDEQQFRRASHQDRMTFARYRDNYKRWERKKDAFNQHRAKAAREWLQQFTERLNNQALVEQYEREMDARNLMHVLPALKDGLTETGRSIVDSAVANGMKWDDSRWSDFRSLEQEEQERVSSVILMLTQEKDVSAWGAFWRKAENMAKEVWWDSPADTVASMTRAWFTDNSYQEEVTSRARRRQMLQDKFRDFGTLGNAFADAGGILGYGTAFLPAGLLARGSGIAARVSAGAGKAAQVANEAGFVARDVALAGKAQRAAQVASGLATAAQILPKVGTALYAIDNQNQYIQRIALDGGDVTNPVTQMAAWSFGVASAMVENIQWEQFGGLRGLEKAQIDAYSKCVHGLFGRLAERYGIHDIAHLSVGRALGTVLLERIQATGFEAFEEAIQQTMEEVVVSIGVNHEVRLADAIGAGIDAFTQSLGPMAITMIAGIPARGASAALNPAFDVNQQEKIYSAAERVVKWLKNGEWDKNWNTDKEKKDAIRSMSVMFSRWASAENDADALHILQRMGMGKDTAIRFDAIFRSIRQDVYVQAQESGENPDALLPKGIRAENPIDVMAEAAGGKMGKDMGVSADGKTLWRNITIGGKTIRLNTRVERLASDMADEDLTQISRQRARSFVQSMLTTSDKGVQLAMQASGLDGKTADEIVADAGLLAKAQAIKTTLDLRDIGGTQTAGVRRGADGQVTEVNVDVTLDPSAFRGTVRHESVHVIEEVLKAVGISPENAKKLARSAVRSAHLTERQNRQLARNGATMAPKGENEKWNEEMAPIVAELMRTESEGPLVDAAKWAWETAKGLLGLQKRQQASRTAVDFFVNAMRTGHIEDLDSLTFEESASDAILREVAESGPKADETAAQDAAEEARQDAAPPNSGEPPAPQTGTGKGPSSGDQAPADGDQAPAETAPETPPTSIDPSEVARKIMAHDAVTLDEMAALKKAAPDLTTGMAWARGYVFNPATGMWAYNADLEGKRDERDAPQRPYVGIDGQQHDPAAERAKGDESDLVGHDALEARQDADDFFEEEMDAAADAIRQIQEQGLGEADAILQYIKSSGPSLHPRVAAELRSRLPDARMQDEADRAMEKRGGEKHFMLRSFADGTQFVEIEDVPAEIRNETDTDKLRAMVAQLIRKRWMNQIIDPQGVRVFVNGRTAQEYAYPAKDIDGVILRAKMDAAGKLDEVVSTSAHPRAVPDGKDGHVHPNVKEWEHRDAIFHVNERYYGAIVNIAIVEKVGGATGNFRLLKDVTQIKDITDEVRNLHGDPIEGSQSYPSTVGDNASQTPSAPDVNSENQGRHQVSPRLPSPEFAMDGTMADALPAHLREDARAIIAERANTPAWMVEPDGTPTDLNERDWLRREAEKRHEAGRRFAISGAAPTAEERAEAQRQYDAVVARFTNPDGTKKPGWMKAPNGQPTRLSERQWVQVRTDNFKRWFGNWEAAAMWQAIERLPQIAVTKRGDSLSVEDAYEALGEGVNGMDGRRIRFVNSALGKILRHKGYPTERIVHQLKDIFEQSVPIGFRPVEDRPGHKQHRNFIGYHDYVGKIQDGEQTFYVRITVQELKTRSKKITPNEFHSSYISDVELYKGTDALALDTENSTGKVGALGSLDRLLADIAGKGKNSSRVVDENGEPLVVWHGTNSEFWQFDPNLVGENYGIDDEGFFFTDDKTDADNYADDKANMKESGTPRTVAAYLKMENPLEVEDTETDEWSNPDGAPNVYYDERKDELLARMHDGGHDGIIVRGKNGQRLFMVANPAQIKSATDNIGTFDGGNADIRYQIAGRAGAERLGIRGLGDAEAMERSGATREEIWRETGWWRGKDGEWRVEVPDFTPTPASFRVFDGGYGAPLSELVHAPELMAAYPELADIPVFLNSVMGAAGQLTERNGKPVIELNAGKALEFFTFKNGTHVLNEYGVRILSHEIQHAIQLQEGFARGASPEYWQRQLDAGYDARPEAIKAEENRLFEQYEKERAANPGLFTAMEALDAFTPSVPRGKFDPDTLEQLEEDPPEWKRFDKRRDELEERYGKAAVFRWFYLREKLRVIAKAKGEDAYGLYRQTAGEVESRNVEKRLKMTPEERAATPPWETEDVEEGRQIVRHSVQGNPHLLEDIRGALEKDENGHYKKSAGTGVRFTRNLPIMDFLGVPVNGVFTTVARIRKMIGEHFLSPEQIASFEQECNRPAAVFIDIDGKGSHVILTGIMAPAEKNGQLKPVMVLLRPEKGGNGGFIASAYSRRAETESAYVSWRRHLRYFDKNKIAGLGLEGETDSQLEPQASGNFVLTASDYSEWSAHASQASSGAEVKSEGGGEGSGGGRAAVEGRVRAFDNAPRYSPRGTMAALATLSYIAGEKPNVDHLEEVGRRLGGDVDAKEAIAEAKTIHDGILGKLSKKENRIIEQVAQRVGNAADMKPGEVAEIVAGAVQALHPEDLVREAYMRGAGAQDWAQGTRGAALNALVRQARGDNYADTVAEVGVDATGVLHRMILERPPKAKAEGEVRAAGDGAAQEKQSQVVDVGPQTQEVYEAAAALTAQQEENLERALTETREEMERRREEQAEREARESAEALQDDSGDTGDDDDGGDVDENDHGGEADSIQIPVEMLERNLVNVRDPATFACLLRKITRNRILKANGMGTDFDDLDEAHRVERELWANPTNVAMFAKSMGAILRDMANRMLDHSSGAYTALIRKAALLPHYDSADVIELEMQWAVRTLAGSSIRQTSGRIVNQTRAKLTTYIGPSKRGEHAELEDDLARKITGHVREMAKWYRRVLSMSEGEIERKARGYVDKDGNRHDGLLDVLRNREKALDETGMGGQEGLEADAVWNKAAWKLAVLSRFGGTRYLLPAEARERCAEIETWMAKEALKQAQKIEALARKYEADRKTIIDGCAVIDPVTGEKRIHEQDTKTEAFWRATVNTINQRLRYLFARAGGKTGQAAQELIRRTSLELSRGTTRYLREKQEMRRDLVLAVRSVVGRRGVRKWLKRMTSEIPEEHSVALSRQGYRHLTYGQVMHLYGYLRQTATYGENIAKHGREWQRDYIEQHVLTPEDLKILNLMMKIYADRRSKLDEASRDITGFPMLNPDPFYLPVKIKTPTRGGLETTVSTVQAMPEVFSERRKHGLDVDEKMDIMVMFHDRMEKTARVLGFGRTGLDIIHTFGDAKVKEAITEARGAKFTHDLIAHLTDWMNGGRPRLAGSDTEDSKLVNGLRTFAVYEALWGNSLSAFKQTLSSPVLTLAREIGDRGIFQDIAGRFAPGWKQAKVELTQSDAWKARYGDVGIMQETQDAVIGAGEGSLWQALLRAGMAPLQWGDARPAILCQVTEYMVERDRLIEEGMEPEEAKRLAADKAMQDVEWTQQSSRAENLPRYARSGDSGKRMLMMFASSPMLQLGWEVQRYVEWKEKRDAFGKDSKESIDAAKAFWNSVIVNHVVMPILFQVATMVFNGVLGKKEPDKDDLLELIFSMISGPFARLAFWGGAMKALYGAFTLRNSWRREAEAGPAMLANNVLSIGDAALFLHDLVSDGWDAAMKDLERFLKRNLAPYRHARKAIDAWAQ